jgi:hypothetical protein
VVLIVRSPFITRNGSVSFRDQPQQFAVHYYEFDIEVVGRSDDPWTTMVVEQTELLAKVYLSGSGRSD